MTHLRRLGVNIDHVATIRQARRSPYPDPVAAAMIAEMHGADQITCHIRLDRRHIQDADLPRLRDSVQTLLNIEMAATEDMITLALDVLGGHRAPAGRKHRITLVPERPGEVTTEGGLDVNASYEEVLAAAERLSAAGIAVALFIDPEESQVRASMMPGVDMVELNTARYAEHDPGDLGRLKNAAQIAHKLDLDVAAGHGLTHHSLPDLVQAVPEIIEYNIGHSIIARSIFVGLEGAVRDIKEIIER